MDRDGPPRGRQVFAKLSCFHLLQFLACYLVHRAVLVFMLSAHVSEVDKLIGRSSCVLVHCIVNLSVSIDLLHQFLTLS